MNTVLVTGSNRGIGLEIVRQYAQDGWRVLACCRMPTCADKLYNLKNNHPNIVVFQLDVSSVENIGSLAAQIQGEPIDILMNNAGVWGPQNQSFASIDPIAWLEAFKVNTIAPQLLAEALINNILNGKLKIIANMSSIMGSIELNTFGGSYIYRSCKAALGAITKNIAIDLKDKNIKVIALHPGWVKTDMGGPNAQITTEESVQGIRQVLSKLSISDSGSFIGYNGEKLAW